MLPGFGTDEVQVSPAPWVGGVAAAGDAAAMRSPARPLGEVSARMWTMEGPPESQYGRRGLMAPRGRASKSPSVKIESA